MKDVEGGRYGNPVLAAMASKKYQTLEVLVKRTLEKHPNGCTFPYASKGVYSVLVQQSPEALFLFTSVYNVNATWTNKDGKTLLAWSAEQGHYKVVELLLSKGADVNPQGGRLGNALQAASARGQDKVVELLLSKGANVNA